MKKYIIFICMLSLLATMPMTAHAKLTSEAAAVIRRCIEKYAGEN